MAHVLVSKYCDRTVPFPQQFVTAIYAIYRDIRTAVADESHERSIELAFSTHRGKPIGPSGMLKKAVYRALEKLNLPKMGWRAFRHTVAALLQHLGVSVKVAQDQPGHSNATTTLGIHTHAFLDPRKAAISQLTAQLFPDVPKFGPKARKVGRQLLEVVKDSEDVGGPARI